MLSILLAGVIVRLPLTDEALMAFSPQRQYYSALTARALYHQIAAVPIPDAERAAAQAYIDAATRTEPPVIEAVLALVYGIIGGENVRIGIALSWVYWGVGGVFLFLLTRDLSKSAFAGWIAGGVYVLLPYSVVITKGLLTDPLALMFMLAALWLMGRSPRGALPLAALAGAAAVLVRAQTALFLLPCAAALWVGRWGWRSLLSGRGAALALACTLPAGLYLLATGGAAARLDTTFSPSLFGQESFWLAWRTLIDAAFPLPLTALAAACALLAWRGTGRRLALAWWGGYALYAAVFNVHIHTHPYYQTLLVPAVAFSLAGAAGRIDRALTARYVRRAWRRWKAEIWREVPSKYRYLRYRGGRTWLSSRIFYTDSYRMAVTSVFLVSFIVRLPDKVTLAFDPALPDAYRAAGAAVQHSPNAAALTQHWGTPLMYYGALYARPYPTRYEIDLYAGLGAGAIAPLSPAERIGAADYFIVTDLPELARQPDLQAYLDANAVQVAAGALLVVYDLRRMG